jgi:NADH-quinone oxidoreductase subunit G
MIRYSKGGNLVPATWDQAVDLVAEKFKAAGSIGVIASPRLTNESIFTLRRFAETAGNGDYAVAESFDLAPVFDNLSVPLATHEDIRYAKTILLVGGEPEEEQTFTGRQIRYAVNKHNAKLIVVNDTPIRMTDCASVFLHINRGSYDAFALAFADSADETTLRKLGVTSEQFDAALKMIGETQGDLVIMLGSELSPNALAALAAATSNFSSDTGRILLHPLAKYNNSVGANDMMPSRKPVADVVKNANALLIGGSLQDASVLDGAGFVVVQEMFETDTTAFADVVLPASSFAEVDGTYTNNAGNVQRVRKAIDNLHQSKPDWMITTLIARELGIDFGYDFSASMVFKGIADNVPAYAGLRYPALKDESRPVQVKHEIKPNAALSTYVARLRESVSTLGDDPVKNTERPRIGHKLHRVTVMTGKTEQFHLLANGNPKPENLLVSPLIQFDLDGTPKEEGMAEAASVTLNDRAVIGVNN